MLQPMTCVNSSDAPGVLTCSSSNNLTGSWCGQEGLCPGAGNGGVGRLRGGSPAVAAIGDTV